MVTMKLFVTKKSTPVVAIVDDKRFIREALSSLLASAGYRTTDYESAEVFLAAADRALATCLIVDFHLPGMTGLDLQGRLAEIQPGCAVILISADMTPDRKKRALQAGAVAALKKPFGDEALLAAVRLAVASTSSPGNDKPTSPADSERREIEALIKRMSAGDQSALAAFYDRFSPTLFGLALRMLKDETGSEDVLQEAFVCMWNKAATYNPELNGPFSWAVMIVRNKAIDRLRSRYRVEKIVELATAEFSHTLDFDARSAEEPFFREQRELVRAALAKLPEEQRQAINLAFFGGLTHEEIAAHLKTPAGTIKSRIRRGLLKLRDLMAEAR
jgi:RNA polymerase sigma-70 factor (ECF subfamily)